MKVLALVLACIAVFVVVTTLRAISQDLPKPPPPPEWRRGRRKKDGRMMHWR